MINEYLCGYIPTRDFVEYTKEKQPYKADSTGSRPYKEKSKSKDRKKDYSKERQKKRNWE